MNLSGLRPPAGQKKAGKRIGRGMGSGHGKTSTRGHKGQHAGTGFSQKRGFEGGQMPLHRRLPKRGFHNLFRKEFAVVNLDVLAEAFEAGTVITPELMRERGLLRGATRPVKVLGRGELSVALTVHADKFSDEAAKKIVAAGGKAEVPVAAAAE
jgi:large subunit ribosomal protein L15